MVRTDELCKVLPYDIIRHQSFIVIVGLDLTSGASAKDHPLYNQLHGDRSDSNLSLTSFMLVAVPNNL